MNSARNQETDRFSASPWHIVDFALAFEDTRLSNLKALWDRKRGDRVMPARADFDPTDLREHIGSLFLVDVLEGGDDFQYRLIGSAIVDAVGRDVTGKKVSDVFEEPILRLYRHLVQHPTPVRTHGTVEWRQRCYLEHECILLPLSDDGRTVNKFICEMVFTPTSRRAAG